MVNISPRAVKFGLFVGLYGDKREDSLKMATVMCRNTSETVEHTEPI